MPGIILVGLGPGAPDQITREAWKLLSTASEVWLRTRHHPAIADLPPSVVFRSFDELCENGGAPETFSAGVVQRVLELGRRAEGVTYAVAGHPLVAEATGAEVLRRATAEGLPVRVVGGLSFLEPALSALGLDLSPRITLCDALSLAGTHVPPYPPDAPALVSQLHSRPLAAKVGAVLCAIYPREHEVHLIHAAGTPRQLVERVALSEIDHSEHMGALTCLYVPPLEQGTSLEALQEVVAHLRAPEGCPWDRAQTHESLRRHLLEETYEVLAAMDIDAADAVREELGDLLLQILLNSQISAEHGQFTLNDVSQGIHNKIVRRHPHVFGDLRLEGVESVLANWERLKEGERHNKQSSGGLLEGVPLALPALSQAQEYQDRAARVGFDWPEVQGVLDKVEEEIREVRAAVNREELTAELGDLLFAIVNFSRWKDIDAESSLRTANQRFKRRFGFIEQDARRRARRLSELTLEEMEALWQQAKASEG